VTSAGRVPSAGPPAAVAEAAPRVVTGTGAELLAQFPPRLVPSSWPATRADRHDVLARLLEPPFALANPLSQQTRRLGLVTVLNWLEAQPGRTWQERWLASGAEGQQDWRSLAAAWKAARSGAPPGRLPPKSPWARIPVTDPDRPASTQAA